jgi:hypothetical protein
VMRRRHHPALLLVAAGCGEAVVVVHRVALVGVSFGEFVDDELAEANHHVRGLTAEHRAAE